MLEHVPDDRKALAEMKRVLKDDGMVLFLVPVDLGFEGVDEAWGLDGEENLRRFGGRERCRRYSRAGMLARVGEEFSVLPLGKDFFGESVFRQAGLTDSSTLYLLCKPEQAEKTAADISALQSAERETEAKESPDESVGLGVMTAYARGPEDDAFSEEKSVRASVTLREDYFGIVRLDALGEIEQLRVDPMDCACFLSGVRVCLTRADGESLNAPIVWTNAIACAGGLLFDTDDPQLLLEIPRGRYQAVSLSCRQISGSTSGIAALVESAREYAEQARALEEALARYDEQTRTLEEALARYDEQAQTLEEALARYDARTRELDEIRTLYDGQTRELDETKALYDARTRELDEARALYDAQARKLDETRALYDAQTVQLLAVTASFTEISNAACWRMTAPIRKVLDAVKMSRFACFIQEAVSCWRTQGFRAMAKWVRAGSSKRSESAASVPEQEEPDAEECGDQEAYSFAPFLADCEKSGAVFGRELLYETTGRDRVLFVSHELNLTGAPIALLYFAEDIKKRGMAPVFIAPRDDRLREKLLDEGIPVIVYPNLYNSDLIVRAASCFQLIVVNTIVGAPLISRLGDCATPVLWWIHEAKVSYHPGAVDALPEQLGDNIHIYCMGKQSEKWMHLYRKNYKNDILLYCQPDFMKLTAAARSVPLPPPEGKTVFLMVGMIEERKGQDILADAIAMLPEEELKKCQFLFVGKEYYPFSLEKIRYVENLYPENVFYLGGMDIADMPFVYQSCDCLICPSRDDTGPITVTEALSLSKIVICSENAGSAVLLERDHSGLIYPNDDPKALAESILYVLHNKEKLGEMQLAARKTYESYFSEDVFSESVSRILTQLFKAPDEPDVVRTTVSVIVPVFNGGEDLKRLLGALHAQLGIESIETVIVDSGSSDQSLAYAESAGAKLIRISQAEFSHSYARNLGAQHASGEYLLFMTQDACPSGPYWLRGMLRPILRQGAAAVSCREEPRPGCDLLGRVSIFNHSSYMGILDSDRILQMPDEVSADTLRKNAQLNDVACLIRRDVFEQYYYRRDYAEDLDLGLRLIRDGYRLALLSGVHVIHSHTRPPMYHFKRGIVDVSKLSEVLPGYVGGSCPERYTINRILTAYCVIKLYVQAAREYRLAGDGRDAWNCFREWTMREIDSDLAAVRRMKSEERKALMESERVFSDADYRKVILEMLDILKGDFSVEPTTVNEIRHYLVNVLDSYFEYTKEPFSDPAADEICILAEKLTGLCAGNLVGTYSALNKNENSELNRLAKKYAQGI